MYSLEELFCPIDDFCLKFEPMLYEHPTISDCGTNRVRWRKQLIASGKRETRSPAKTKRSYDDRGCIRSISLQKLQRFLFGNSE